MTDTTPWREIERSTVFTKFGRAVDRVGFELPDGRKEEFYLKRERPAGAVLALTPDQRVILARQYRPGPDRVLYELPGGYVEPGEQAVDAIARELLEETGYSGKVRPAGAYWHDAYSTVQKYAFVATDCIKTTEPAPERTEFIDVVTLTLEEFRTRVLRTGEMTDTAAAYLALDLLKLL
ncbi:MULTISPECIES: NUDIX hydrolase [Streptomycetaceae]|uniref:ADP-ribose pyrophosphatase n=1 Tax=Streptantibioticus cattleyicolor (strain ATCC 35852 / DSM 46488 / JCM 4925 / NBRC 14057 / NRRL 8057) TaxID=1003195 RepID=F8JXA5_STREN|nr:MULTISPECIES: NUDIX hydrolase [Streptomycetaceae]AEW94573.1 ADP-ribose pyrophosphatase [Streptantibioticus cattleyicolor NRRL 8057 = DSM 46488]MYS59211.1 NUDIX domain-containing protein [Streptomyces sp. SID5468]CCB74932.1 ADP-ribose pyrophosphatase [Streptantibioticus cattleyicolor NRRL 8057 = DSM 46488]